MSTMVGWLATCMLILLTPAMVALVGRFSYCLSNLISFPKVLNALITNVVILCIPVLLLSARFAGKGNLTHDPRGMDSGIMTMASALTDDLIPAEQDGIDTDENIEATADETVEAGNVEDALEMVEVEKQVVRVKIRCDVETLEKEGPIGSDWSYAYTMNGTPFSSGQVMEIADEDSLEITAVFTEHDDVDDVGTVTDTLIYHVEEGKNKDLTMTETMRVDEIAGNSSNHDAYIVYEITYTISFVSEETVMVQVPKEKEAADETGTSIDDSDAAAERNGAAETDRAADTAVGTAAQAVNEVASAVKSMMNGNPWAYVILGDVAVILVTLIAGRKERETNI